MRATEIKVVLKDLCSIGDLGVIFCLLIFSSSYGPPYIPWLITLPPSSKSAWFCLHLMIPSLIASLIFLRALVIALDLPK